jgi:hypothetical protein
MKRKQLEDYQSISPRRYGRMPGRSLKPENKKDDGGN